MAEPGELPPTSVPEALKKGGLVIGKRRTWSVYKRGLGWKKISIAEKRAPGESPKRTIKNLGIDETK